MNLLVKQILFFGLPDKTPTRTFHRELSGIRETSETKFENLIGAIEHYYKS